MNRNVTSASSDVKFGELKELFDVVRIDILTDLGDTVLRRYERKDAG